MQVCLVTETGFRSGISIGHTQFKIYRNDRTNSRGGGVAVIVRKGLTHQLLPIVPTELIENIGIKICMNSDSINIYSCYFPGGLMGNDGISRSNQYILGGDFNCRHQQWGCLRTNGWGNILAEKLITYNIDLIYPADFTYILASPNRQGSTLDLFLTNVSGLLSHAQVINDLSSDHLPVKIVLGRNYNSSSTFSYDYNNANWRLYSRFLNRRLTLPEEGTI